MKAFLLIALAFILWMPVLAQEIPEPMPPEPLCKDLGCFSETNAAVSLDLKREIRRGGMPDTSKLDQLLWLDLSANRLEKVPEWVCECTSLQYLNLSRNRLNTLPACLGELKELRHLAANRNPLGSLPPELADCPKLEYLDLWQTWIDFVPWELHELNGQLKVVDLRDIRMTREQQMEIYKVFPDVELKLSAWCNCAPHRPGKK